MSEVVYGLIHEAKGRYGISFPDFPGCVAAGATPDEALRRGAETLRFHVAGMMEDGEALPKFRGLSVRQRHKMFKSDARSAAVRQCRAPGKVGAREHLAGRAPA
jgi:predicted RNase H-like HicB family nuclease